VARGLSSTLGGDERADRYLGGHLARTVCRRRQRLCTALHMRTEGLRRRTTVPAAAVSRVRLDLVGRSAAEAIREP
jgi:hypothetical protein